LKTLTDKVAVVTGAAGGIGRAMVRAFVAEGMNVVMAGIDEGRLNAAAGEFRKAGADVAVVTADVSRADQVAALAHETVERYGAVHLLCNNAGVSYNSRSSWETPLAAWEWVLGVNLMGVVHGIHAFLPRMLEQADEAYIVNTASNSGLVMNSYAVSYGVSKHAVVALSESLHLELKRQKANIGVSVLCPGPVDTEIVDAAYRNLPSMISGPDLSEEELLLENAYRQYLAQGISPDEVAKQVVSAVAERRFYIFTHDYRESIETRMRNLIEEKNPEPSPPNPTLMAILVSLLKGGGAAKK
jgi:NAD(P)-dependent dehydrogenase (short-subunit alcohol dehydrogenase family)